jgi:hypothetical protein
MKSVPLVTIFLVVTLFGLLSDRQDPVTEKLIQIVDYIVVKRPEKSRK